MVMKNLYDYKDKEPNLFLRKLRGRLGYGVGWTFWGALVDWATPKVFLVLVIALWLYLSLHLEIFVDFDWIK